MGDLVCYHYMAVPGHLVQVQTCLVVTRDKLLAAVAMCFYRLGYCSRGAVSRAVDLA